MWTPKRILLLVVGFALFLGAYLVYAHFLGGVDGLKPLPDEYGPIAEDILPPEPVRERDSTIDEKLRLAFGDNCPELKRKTNLEIGSRGMVLSIGDFKALPDGRVELTPFSLAIFGKAKGDAKSTPEINTVQCQVALLTFDRPVANPGELVNRKIVAGELRGDIYLINNRRTPQRDDDISVFTRGPLFYQEARNQEAFNRIWTDADVKLVDLLSKPEPMTITGTGMDIQLTNDSRSSVAGQTAPPKRKTEGPSGVDWVRLRKDVVLNLWVDARSGFLGSGKGTGDKGTASQRPLAAGSPGSSPADKSEVVIRTRGPFTYDVRTDRATFEMLQTQRANFVTVDRIDKVEGKLDSLACEHLEVQFRRKSAAAGPRAAEGAAEGLDVETARATGKEVVLTSDAEFLEAHGTDFFYDKRTRQSILKGSPRMWALKEGNEIHAHELLMINVKGGFRTTGRTQEEWPALEDDARAISEAGAFAVVLEGMAEPLAARITRTIPIPTIGIGASPDCDGQVLVLEDMLGLNPNPPKFVREYARLGQAIEAAVEAYAMDVRERRFPGAENVYPMKKAGGGNPA